MLEEEISINVSTNDLELLFISLCDYKQRLVSLLENNDGDENFNVYQLKATKKLISKLIEDFTR